MKKRVFSLFLALFTMLSGILAMTACSNNIPSAPEKLTAPTVSLRDNVAIWESDPKLRNLKSVLTETYHTLKIRLPKKS